MRTSRSSSTSPLVKLSSPRVQLLALLKRSRQAGSPRVVRGSPATVVGDAGKALAVCGLCYAASFIAQSMRPETQSALPAWIPIFIFGTLAVVLLDRVRT